MDIHHPFVSRFPNHRETIRTLRLADPKLRAMFEEYPLLDDEICHHVEEGIEICRRPADRRAHKFKRNRLKVALYGRRPPQRDRGRALKFRRPTPDDGDSDSRPLLCFWY